MSLFRPSRMRQMLFSSLEAFAVPLVMLVSTPILLRVLGQEWFGVWALINSISAMTSLANWGFSEAVITFGSQHLVKDEKQAAVDVYLTSIFSCVASVLGLLGLVLILIQLLQNYELMKGYTVGALAAPLFAGSMVFSFRLLENTVFSFFKLHLQYQFSSLYSFLSKFLGMSIQVLVLTWGWTLAEAFLSTAAVTLVVIFIAGNHIRMRFQIPLQLRVFTHYWAVLIKNFHFSFHSWVQSLMLVINANLDKILVGKALGPLALSYYSIGSTIIGQIHLLFSAGFQSLLPEFAQMRGQGGAAKDKTWVKKYAEHVFLSVLLYGVIVFILMVDHEALIMAWLKGNAGMLPDLLPYFLLYEFFFLLNIVPYFLLLSFERVKLINQILLFHFILLTASVGGLFMGWDLKNFLLIRAGMVLISTLVFHVKALKLLARH